MTTFIRFAGRLWENLTFVRSLGWETERIAHRPAEGDGSYQLELLDASGKVLVAVSPQVDFAKYCLLSDIAMRSTRVIGYLPLHPEARALVFRKGDHIIERETVAAKPPRVRILDTKAQMRGRIRLSWRAMSSGDKPLSYNVAYQAGNKEQGIILARGLRRTSFVADLTRCPASKNGRLAVLATDGTRSSFAVSRRIGVVEKPPVASIQQPYNGQELPADHPINLCGQAMDIAGASLSDQFLIWQVDGKEVARGVRLALAGGLEPGRHVVTLRYRPKKGKSGFSSVTIQIARRSAAHNRLRKLLAEGAL